MQSHRNRSPGSISSTLVGGMNASVSLHGLGTALVTPLLADGSLDLSSLRSLVEWQIACGVTLLVACGSTGEAATLSEDETERVVQTVAEAAAGRVAVFAGSTHNNTAEAVRRAAGLARINGVDGILTANPYYSKPNQRGQYLHFKAVAEAVGQNSGKVVLLYNIPGRTAANLLPETVLRLAEIENVAGVKESSGNMEQIAEVIAGAPEGFAVLAGDDYLAVPVMEAGGHGLVSVVSNVVPQRVGSMVGAAQHGQWAEAQTAAGALAPLTAALFAEPNPAPVKSLLHSMGRIATPTLRLPMVPVEDALAAKLQELVAPLQ